MYYIIETLDQLKTLYNRQTQTAFVEVIPFNYNTHPTLNKVSLVYIRPFDDYKGYVICVNHSESSNIKLSHVDAVLKNIPNLWVRNKKQFLYYFQIKKALDISFIYPTELTLTNTHSYFYQKYPLKDDVNRIIPISKHYELCETVYNQIKPNIPHHLPEWFDFYNNRATLAFFGIEKNGININKTLLDKYYETNNDYYSIKGDRIFTQYNLYTTTRRPSNSYNNINFAALKKETREAFISSENNVLVEIDISAYHPTLAAQLIKYDFGDRDIHSEFAKMYGVDYKTAKELTFKQLYGGVFEEYAHLEYFKKIQMFIDDAWDTLQYSKYYTCPISKFTYYLDKLDNMNPNKLFNYILQNLETSNNTNILLDIHKILKNKNTKIILYTYDSFLFDYDKNEKEVMSAIVDIFKKYSLQIKINNGNNYNFQ
jgi:hypothetical protein